MSKNVSIFSSSLTRPISHLIKISKVLHLYLFNSLSLTPALTMSYYICVFMLLFLSALSLSILSFPSLLSPFPSVSHTFLCPSVLPSIFLLLAPFLSLHLCVSLRLCRALSVYVSSPLTISYASAPLAHLILLRCPYSHNVLHISEPGAHH